MRSGWVKESSNTFKERLDLLRHRFDRRVIDKELFVKTLGEIDCGMKTLEWADSKIDEMFIQNKKEDEQEIEQAKANGHQPKSDSVPKLRFKRLDIAHVWLDFMRFTTDSMSDCLPSNTKSDSDKTNNAFVIDIDTGMFGWFRNKTRNKPTENNEDKINRLQEEIHILHVENNENKINRTEGEIKMARILQHWIRDKKNEVSQNQTTTTVDGITVTYNKCLSDDDKNAVVDTCTTLFGKKTRVSSQWITTIGASERACKTGKQKGGNQRRA